jgi:hypothetical protein
MQYLPSFLRADALLGRLGRCLGCFLGHTSLVGICKDNAHMEEAAMQLCVRCKDCCGVYLLLAGCVYC